MKSRKCKNTKKKHSYKTEFIVCWRLVLYANSRFLSKTIIEVIQKKVIQKEQVII